jgi:hypothetical protein
MNEFCRRGSGGHKNGERATVRQSEAKVTGVARRVAIAAGLLVLGGCHEGGLPDRNLPLQEARHREYGYPVYQPVADNPQVAAAGRHWMRTVPVETIPARLLSPVATTNGVNLYAVEGHRAPYSRLYAPVGEDRWVPYVPVN